MRTLWSRLTAGLAAVLLLPGMAAAEIRLEFVSDQPAMACTPSQQTIIAQAFEDAARNSVHVRDRLVRQNPVADSWPPYVQFFGKDSRTLPRIVKTVELTAEFLTGPAENKLTVACNRPGKDYCNGKRRSQVDMSNKRVYFCDGFFTSSGAETRTRWGTVLHEVTHLAADTEDDEYGLDKAKRRALESTASAAVNAENHRYFAEGVVSEQQQDTARTQP